jgi:RNA polymerase sigma factor (sigma-70 family)
VLVLVLGQEGTLSDELVLDCLDQQMAHVDRRPGDTLDEKIAALRECIEHLGPLYREPIELHYRQHRTTEWIAERLATTKDAVQKQLQRARGQLADCLQRKGVLARPD